jgi:photosystem II stability/assembly factor-like uncharacterized protein
MRRIVVLAGLALLLGASSAAAGRPGYAWHDTPTGTTDHFRGLSAVSATTAWVSGYTAAGDGAIMRTTDRGTTWQDVTPPASAGLQFRDIEAFDASNAVAMSIGNNPTDFRMYVTHDGGQTWAITFVNAEPTAFYDCMSFFNRKVGLAISDPPDGVHFRVIATNDGGMSWHITGLQMPEAPGAYAFAASGECLTTDHGHRAWFGTGGSEASVFRSDDRGVTWTKAPTPMLFGPTAGINGLAFNGQQRGIAVGGDFALPTSLARQLRPLLRRRLELEPRPRCACRVPLRRHVGRRQHGDRGRALRQRRQHQLRRDVDALRRRQPRHDRLREPDSVLGLRRRRPRRVSRSNPLAAADQLDPVAVRILDEAEPRAALAHLVRRALRLDPCSASRPRVPSRSSTPTAMCP